MSLQVLLATSSWKFTIFLRPTPKTQAFQLFKIQRSGKGGSFHSFRGRISHVEPKFPGYSRKLGVTDHLRPGGKSHSIGSRLYCAVRRWLLGSKSAAYMPRHKRRWLPEDPLFIVVSPQGRNAQHSYTSLKPPVQIPLPKNWIFGSARDMRSNSIILQLLTEFVCTPRMFR